MVRWSLRVCQAAQSYLSGTRPNINISEYNMHVPVCIKNIYCVYVCVNIRVRVCGWLITPLSIH